VAKGIRPLEPEEGGGEKSIIFWNGKKHRQKTGAWEFWFSNYLWKGNLMAFTAMGVILKNLKPDVHLNNI
jgi:hypothetical protein